MAEDDRERLRSQITAVTAGDLCPVSLLPSTLLRPCGSPVKVDLFIVDRRRATTLGKGDMQWAFLMGIRVVLPPPAVPASAAPALASQARGLPPDLAAAGQEEPSVLGSLAGSACYASIPDTLQSACLPEPSMHCCRREELEAALSDGARGSCFQACDCPQTQATVRQALDVLLDQARGGALVCVGDAEAFRHVFGDGDLCPGAGPALRSSDGGYMTKRLRGVHVGDPDFAAAFAEFTAHTDSDRWPDDHRDADARGRPKDGAILLSKNGYVLKCAVKLLGLCPAAKWKNVGTKHEAALSCAWAVPGVLVFVRSDSGSVHVVRRQSSFLHVYEIQSTPAAQ